MSFTVFKKISYSIFLLLLLVTTGATAQKGKTNRELNKLMKEYKAVGLAVVVVKNNKIAYAKSLGYKNKEAKTPLKEEDIFRIASISKSFVATSIMQLVEGGKLSLSDDVSKLVGFTVRNPAYPDDVITLRMLLSHTSSINDKQGYFEPGILHPEKNKNWANSYNSYRPGEGYQYCNLNFNMAGMIVERVSNERFDTYIRNHILRPLQLYGGHCIDSLDASRFATLYEYDSSSQSFTAAPNAYHPRQEELKNYVQGESTFIFSPTGGMKISALDLARYMTLHMNYGEYNGVRILSKESAEAMQAIVAEKAKYGLALSTTDSFIPPTTLIGHTGSAYGLYSTMFFNPKEKYGIVAITNGCNPVYKGGYNQLLQSTAQVLYSNFIR